MLPGLVGIMAGLTVAPLTATFTDSASSPTDTTSYSFTSQSIGTASSDRYVVVIAEGYDNNGSNGFLTCTVAGASTTKIYDVSLPSNGNPGIMLAAFITDAPVTSGTTATIVVTTLGTTNRMAAQFYTITGGTPVAYDTLASTSTDPSGTIDCPVGGCIIAGAMNISSNAVAWTGVTEDVETSITEGPSKASSAHVNLADGELGRTIQATFTGADATDAMIAVSFGPG